MAKNGKNGKTAEALTFETRIDLKSSVRTDMVALLNHNLADLSDLHSQTKQAHWNVKGKQFIALHKLFDELAEAVEDYVDDIAERAVEMGGYALGTNRMSAAATRLPEYPTSAVDSMEHVQALAERYALVAKHVRAAINVADGVGDKDTSDLFTEVSRGLDKWLWFLEAHLQS